MKTTQNNKIIICIFHGYNIIHATTSTAATEAAKDRAVILVLLLNTVRLVWIAPISYVVLVAATATVLPVLYSLNGNTD